MGLIKKLLKLKFYIALVAAGYLLHSCVNNDYRYRIERSEGKHYLVDLEPNDHGMYQSMEINTQTFQVGTIDYRLRGLLSEHDLQDRLEQMYQKLEVEK